MNSIWPIDRILIRYYHSGQGGPESDGNEEVLCILQSSSITGAPPSDCLVYYQDSHWWSLTPLQRSSWCILQPQPTGHKCPWCNCYCWKWTWQPDFKPSARLFAFHIVLIPLGKVWIQLFSLQIRANSRVDCAF